MKDVFFSDIIGRFQDRRVSGLQTAGVLITATLGLCRLLLVLDTVQAQGIKKPNNLL